ncbi:MAG: xanthine dehydrogenase family protein molybdopterin-binding subunit [Myxococcota bacterium]
MSGTELTRRGFLVAGSLAGGGLAVGASLRRAEASPAHSASADSTFAPDVWIRIASDGRISFRIDRAEIGQGVTTALSQLLAEELEVDPETVEVGFASDRMQMVGGSSSIRRSWEPLRRAGAAAREMLVRAAAERWQVPQAECVAADARVIHAASGRSASYGELAEEAATYEIPAEPRLKEPGEWKTIGRPLGRVDARIKVDGSAEFGVDVKLPGLRTAVVLRSPVFGGTLAGYSGDVPADVSVIEIASGLAVVAKGYWRARQTADKLVVDWDEGENARLSSASLTDRFRELAAEEGKKLTDEGDAVGELERSASTLEAVYELPFQAHATMEPQNCTAWLHDGICEIWVPTQNLSVARRAAARISGIDEDRVIAHQMLAGGGFGRRAEFDFVAEAVELAGKLDGPVRVLFSREDDIQHDYYRPLTVHRLRAGFDADGQPTAWCHHVVGPSLIADVASRATDVYLPGWVPGPVRGALRSVALRLIGGWIADPTTAEGASELPYDIANVLVEATSHGRAVPIGFWRSVGHSHNGFVVEGFVDELAVAAGEDPFEFRRRLLQQRPRNRGVLELAARRAGWGDPLAPGRARGIAQHESFGSYVAQVAEVSVSDSGEIIVHRMVCSVDCGRAINPDIVTAQMESGIAFGLTAALKSEITVENGRVLQSNFHDFPLLRMSEMPQVEVHILESGEELGGIGEVGTPPAAAAVANAVFAATGQRLRKLPLRLA